MAWIVPVATAVAGYFSQDSANKAAKKNSYTDMYTESNPWGPTVQGRQAAIGSANDIYAQHFGNAGLQPPQTGDPRGGGVPKDPAPPDLGLAKSKDGDPDPGTIRTGDPSSNYGFQYGPQRPGQSPTMQFNNTPPPQVGYNAGAPPSMSGGGGGGGATTQKGGGDTLASVNRRIAEAQAQGDTARVKKLQAQAATMSAGPSKPSAISNVGGGGTQTKSTNWMTDDLYNQANDSTGPAGIGRLENMTDNYAGPRGLDDLMNMAKNTDANNPYRDDLYNKAGNYHGSQAMQDLMQREMDKNAAGYKTDDFQAAQDRLNNYKGPQGLSDYINTRMQGVTNAGGGNSGGSGGGNAAIAAARAMGPRPANVSGGGGYYQNQGGPNDPSLGNGEGTYDKYVKQMLDSQYEQNPQLQAMIDMQTRRMQDDFQQNILPGMSFDAESSGRFGSDAYQMAQAQAAGKLMQSIGDVNTQYGFNDYNTWNQNRMQALGMGVDLQNNRADNQTSMANARTSAEAQMSAASSAAASAQAGIAAQERMHQDEMLMRAFGMQGDADQFSIGGGMDAAKYGMDYDSNRTGQLMNFANQQTGAETTAMGYQRDLSNQYDVANANNQANALAAMQSAVGYGLDADKMQFGNAGAIIQAQQNAQDSRFNTMGQAAGYQNQFNMNAAQVAAQQEASRRSANVARQGQNLQIQMQNNANNMEQWRLGNQADIMNWQQSLVDQQNQQGYDLAKWQYEQNAPMDFLNNYLALQNAAGAGGGSSHQYGNSGGVAQFGSPIGAAVAGAGYGYNLAYGNR